MTTPAIEITGLSKTYRGKVRALRGVDMAVQPAEIFGLLGPNGAGKSTLVKILMTIIRPSSGSGRLLGEPLGTKRALRRVGFLPEHHSLPGHLTGAQVIDFYGALHVVPRRERRRRGAELLELVGMSAWSRKRVREYSKGMRQRLGLAQALVNDPALVVLDEPTDGVDPVGRRDIREVLTRLRQSGKTILLNSHLLSELEMVCDRVAIMVQGQVRQQGTLDELTLTDQHYHIELAQPLAPWPLPASLPGGEAIEPAGESALRVRTVDAGLIQPVIDRLRAAGAVIRVVRPVRPSLEELFMRAVTDPTTGLALEPGAAATGERARRGASR